MCKVLIIPAIKAHRRDETNAFILEMAILMSKYNSDGIGYAAVDKDGTLFAEHWFKNYMFGTRPSSGEITDIESKLKLARAHMDPFGPALRTFKKEHNIKPRVSSENYNSFGTMRYETDATAITLHTRMATCDKTLANVHPFVDKDTSVIHNGVISNKDDFDLKLSTCDSESILISYLKNKVGLDISNTQKMSDELYGYYAVGAFARDAAGARILDVFKANNYNLTVAYIFELETYVLSSSDTDIIDACKSLGFTHGGTQDIENDYITRINPFTGEIIGQQAFKGNLRDKPKVYNQVPTSYADKWEKGPGNVWKRKDTPKATTRSLIELFKLPSSITQLNERDSQELLAELRAI